MVALQILGRKFYKNIEKSSLYFQSLLTLSQTTNFRIFQTERFTDDDFKFDEYGRKFSKWVENTGEKEKFLVTSNFSFSHSVFKRIVLQTRKNQGLFGKGLIFIHKTPVVVNHPTTREIRDLLRPRSTRTGNTVYFYMSSSFIYILKIHR